MNKPQSTHSLKQPSALWFSALCYIFYTLSFGILLGCLIVYFIHGLGLSEKKAFAIFAGFNAILWTFPILGGYFSGRYGYKNMAIIGTLICTIGAACLALSALTMMYLGLGLYIIGYGLSTPACFSMVGFFYAKQDPRRDSGYTFFYLLFNFGFLCSIFLSGYFVKYFGYPVTFLIAAAAMLCSCLTLIFAGSKLKAYPGRTLAGTHSLGSGILPLLLTAVIGGAAATLLLEHVSITNIVIIALSIGAICYMLYLAARQKTQRARSKLVAATVLTILALGFYTVYMLEPSLLTIFISHNVDRHIGAYTIPASSYFSLDALFVIIFGLIFSWLWQKLEAIKRAPSIPAKFAAGLISMGLGFIIIMIGITFVDPATHQTSMLWVIGAYLCFGIGELLTAPIGMSMMGSLAPKGYEGQLMGIWNLFIGLAATLSGYLASMAAMPAHISPVKMLLIYHHTMMIVGFSSVSLGVIALLLVKPIKGMISA